MNTVIRRLVVFLIVTACAVLLIHALRGALVGLVLAFVIAYLFDPVIDKFENRGYSRTLAIGLVLAGLVLVFGLAGLLVVPIILGEVAVLAERTDQYGAQLIDALDRTIQWSNSTFKLDIPLEHEALLDWLNGMLVHIDPAALDPVASALLVLGSSTIGAIGAMVNLLLVPVYAFYFLRDFDLIKRRVHRLIPVRWQEKARGIYREIDILMGKFIRGQLTVCLALAVLYTLGLVLFARIDMAVMVGVTSGLLFIIPYVGTVVGAIVATILCLLKFGIDIHLLGVIATFGVAQLIEGTLLTPRILGDSTGLHPVVVILSLIVGASLFGFLGLLLAVPAAAAGKVILAEGHQAWMRSEMYLGLAEQQDSHDPASET